MKRFLTPGLLAVGLTALTLMSCSAYGVPAQDSTPQASQAVPVSLSSSNSAPQADVSALEGTLHSVDLGLEYLVVVTDDAYYRFDFAGRSVDLSDFTPGDEVTVAYTGTLDTQSAEITTQLVAIEKAA